MPPTEYSMLERLIENLGVTGLLVFLVYKLADRWASKFITGYAAQGEVIVKQTGALVELATAVRESHTEQRELTMAVRVLAAKVEGTRGWVREMSERADYRELDNLARKNLPPKGKGTGNDE